MCAKKPKRESVEKRGVCEPKREEGVCVRNPRGRRECVRTKREGCVCVCV